MHTLCSWVFFFWHGTNITPEFSISFEATTEGLFVFAGPQMASTL